MASFSTGYFIIWNLDAVQVWFENMYNKQVLEWIFTGISYINRIRLKACIVLGCEQGIHNHCPRRFAPLGLEFFWKKTPQNVAAEGGEKIFF